MRRRGTTHLKDRSDQKHEYDEPRLESTKLRMLIWSKQKRAIQAAKRRTWFCPTTVRMSNSIPVLANSKHSPLSVPDAAPYATPKMTLVRSMAGQLIGSLTAMLSAGSSALVQALTAGSEPKASVKNACSGADPPALFRDTSVAASLPCLGVAASTAPYRPCGLDG